MADLAIAQLHDMREHAEMIANLDPYGPPLIADMDTGYGGKFRNILALICLSGHYHSNFILLHPYHYHSNKSH